jgi:MoaA/NifB/PqqE/SkfB family radical SAM enzyme
MNLIITDRCNRACPYCFAQEKVRLSGRANRARVLSGADFEACVRFLKRSHERSLKLLGGEPTTHPQFSRFVEEGLRQGLEVTVFTNGLWPADVLAWAEACKADKLSFLFNVNEPGLQSAGETRRQARALRCAGERGMIGFNLYRPGFDIRFVAELIGRFGLKREVRLGAAHPIAGQENAFVADADLPKLGERLLEQLAWLEERNILGALDCGFPLCMFPESRLGSLVKCVKPGPHSVCHPVIDVGPDLSVWPCFPLSAVFNVSLRDFKTRDELARHYEQRLAAVRGVGFLDRWLECK